ncbi:hypothetical protein [Sulfobacillus thermosulfidooxidans]|uniref:hypothetical protein n=1 Tax=Sulfobacillus thermosulfidooxidans TaxID=28034 RepID=UPI0006B56D59|nr:hypothetical protein [Sulfobacillus thermosulfidooxidans]
MFLALHGYTNPSLKWTYRKLERYAEEHHQPEALDRYLRVQSLPFPQSDLDHFVADVMNYCEALNVAVQNHLQDLQLEGGQHG